MPRNIEIKARIGSIAQLLPKVAAEASAGPVEINQDDTFFHCGAGRLKLRMFSPGEGQLIFYRRDNERGPKPCFYVISPTADPQGLRETLSLAYGEAGRVIKRRTLFLIGRTRVHLDDVQGLGEFLELEVVLTQEEPAERGMQEAQAIMTRLGLTSAQLIEGAYVDLLTPARG